MLVSLVVMTWIVSGTQLAIHHKDIMYVEKDRSIAGCPKNITFNNHTDFSGYVEKVKIRNRSFWISSLITQSFL